jgi:hypothetical protein
MTYERLIQAYLTIIDGVNAVAGVDRATLAMWIGPEHPTNAPVDQAEAFKHVRGMMQAVRQRACKFCCFLC